ncbi:MAG: hypothetical protein IPK16_12405 [Anaerolineales bacterium]|nr:hypothetical protein [Anaerolineales bacterium]
MKQENIEGPAYAYPRYSSRALAEYLRLGLVEAERANGTPLAVKDVRLVGNLNDEMIRPEMYREMVARWEKQGADVSVFEFPVADGLKHDMIDPNQTYANTGLVYPVVLDAITKEKS